MNYRVVGKVEIAGVVYEIYNTYDIEEYDLYYRHLLLTILREIRDEDERGFYLQHLGDEQLDLSMVEQNADVVGAIREAIGESELFKEDWFLEYVLVGDLMWWLADGYLSDGIAMPKYDWRG